MGCWNLPLRGDKSRIIDNLSDLSRDTCFFYYLNFSFVLPIWNVRKKRKKLSRLSYIWRSKTTDHNHISNPVKSHLSDHSSSSVIQRDFTGLEGSAVLLWSTGQAKKKNENSYEIGIGVGTDKKMDPLLANFPCQPLHLDWIGRVEIAFSCLTDRDQWPVKEKSTTDHWLVWPLSKNY